jgi:hypothetical protein
MENSMPGRQRRIKIGVISMTGRLHGTKTPLHRQHVVRADTPNIATVAKSLENDKSARQQCDVRTYVPMATNP